MVVTETLARGVPVLAAAVGGLPHALGRAPNGTRLWMLVPSGDVGALPRWSVTAEPAAQVLTLATP
jgi:glycosyltransferase involved in cell wall biosynthesis